MTSKRKQSVSTTTVSTDRAFIPLDKSYNSVGEFVRDLEQSFASHNHIYIYNDDYEERTTLISKKTTAIGKLEYYQANGHHQHHNQNSGIPQSKRSEGITIKSGNSRFRTSSVPSLNTGTPPTDHEDDEYDFCSISTSSASVSKERATSTPTSKPLTHGGHSASNNNHSSSTTRHDDHDSDTSPSASRNVKDLSSILVKLSRNHDETTMIVRSYVIEVRYGKQSSGNIECREEPCNCEIGEECHLDRLHEIRGYRITRLHTGGKVECCPMAPDDVLDLMQNEFFMPIATHEVVY